MALLQTVTCDIEECDRDEVFPYDHIDQHLLDAGWSVVYESNQREMISTSLQFCPDHKVRGHNRPKVEESE